MVLFLVAHEFDSAVRLMNMTGAARIPMMRYMAGFLPSYARVLPP
jgi:hypothetical protein